MNLSRASKEFVVCISSYRNTKATKYFERLLKRFIEANGNQDVTGLSRIHIQYYIARELGVVRNGKLRLISDLRRECDMLLLFYQWLARQGYIDPLYPDQLFHPFRRRKGFFLSLLSSVQLLSYQCVL